MNEIRSDFPRDLKKFFYDLQYYLDEDLYFYGSVNRTDYVHGKSDIDVAIFTDNEYSLMTKLQHFLHVKRDSFDKIIWKLDGKMIYGYKIKCDKYTNSKCEIAIYNNDFKKLLLDEMKSYNTIPLYVSMLLFIIKVLYYRCHILNYETYSSYKRYIFNDLYLRKKNTVFFLLKQNKS